MDERPADLEIVRAKAAAWSAKPPRKPDRRQALSAAQNAVATDVPTGPRAEFGAESHRALRERLRSARERPVTGHRARDRIQTTCSRRKASMPSCRSDTRVTNWPVMRTACARANAALTEN